MDQQSDWTGLKNDAREKEKKMKREEEEGDRWMKLDWLSDSGDKG